MAFLSKIGEKFVVPDIFSWSPEASSCIDEWHEIVMRGESPLTVAERELITAFTSRLNGCALCAGVHVLVAERFGVEQGTVEAPWGFGQRHRSQRRPADGGTGERPRQWHPDPQSRWLIQLHPQPQLQRQ